MTNVIKKNIPFHIKTKFWLLRLNSRRTEKLPFRIINRKNPKVFIFLAADYGNLGDVAITYAQHKFLQETFPTHLTTEIPISKTLEGIAFVKKTLGPDDIITTVGGGNMGDLYPMIEHFRQLVIKYFPDNRIISFPQTIDFSKTPKGQKELKKAIKVYGRHKDLTLLAREQKTFEFFSSHFPKNKTFLVPDIVMSLERSEPKVQRKGALICLRADKEKRMTTEQQQELLQLIEGSFGGYIKRDTHIGGDRMSLYTRVKALFQIWQDFRSAELVITDRLHGMIFCFITQTPTLVFLNNNHKVESCYSWIKEAHWISLIDTFNMNTIKAELLKVTEKKSAQNEVSLRNEFDQLAKKMTSL